MHALVYSKGPSVPEQDRDGKKNLSYPFLNGNCDSSRGTLNSDTKERKFHFELMLKEFWKETHHERSLIIKSGWADSTCSRVWVVNRAITLQPAARPLRIPEGASSKTMPGVSK